MKKVFNAILLAFKGFLFGIANLIPGVSGGTMAVVTGIYEKLINSISNIFKQFKKSIIFLLIFAVGLLLAIFLGSKGLDYCLDNFYFPTCTLFLGLVLGGLPILMKEVKHKSSFLNFILILLGLGLVIGLLYLPISYHDGDLQVVDYFILAGVGFIASVAMIIPGLSGMMIFKLFGYYDKLIDTLSNLTKMDLLIDNITLLAPVGFGIIIGLFTAAKVIGFLFKRYKTQSYFVIIGFVIGSCLAICYDFIGNDYDLTQMIVGLILIPVGFIFTSGLSLISDKMSQKEEEKINYE